LILNQLNAWLKKAHVKHIKKSNWGKESPQALCSTCHAFVVPK